MALICARDAAFTYAGAAAPVFAGLSFSVEEGAFCLVTGSTGCGKSTLLRAMKPELAPVGAWRGALVVGGMRLAGEGAAPGTLTQAESARTIGFVDQDPDAQIVCDTVWHELAFGCENLGLDERVMRRRVAEVAHYFGIAPWVQRPTDSLSGGQKQLLNLAAALVLRPRLLLLDEPLAQLDPAAARRFVDMLARVRREWGVTVVAATHDARAFEPHATQQVAPAPEKAAPPASPSASASLTAGRAVSAPLAPADAVAAPPAPVDVAWPAVLREKCATEKISCALHTESVQQIFSIAHFPCNAATKKEANAAGENEMAPTETGVAAEAARPAEADTAAEAARPADTNNPPSLVQEPAVELRDVFVRLSPDGPWVLRGFDLAVAQGTVHALVGGNGSGKTTLLRTVAGLLKPRRGRVRNRLAASQAYLPQDPKALFVCDTVAEELREWQPSAGYAAEDVTEMQHRFGLDGLDARHPYDLSGGQGQNLALAKLLLCRPRLLLLDEPTKGLDARAAAIVVDALRDFARAGGTVLLATHDLDAVDACATQATLLFDGQAACTQDVPGFFEDNFIWRPRGRARSQGGSSVQPPGRGLS